MKKLFLILTLAIVLFANTAFSADVTLGWDANTEADLAGYRVYYGTTPGTYLQAKGSGLDAGKVTEYTVKGLTKGPKYYFAVTAYDSEVPSLESGYSNEASTNFGPAVPGGVKVKVVVEVTVP